MLRVVARPPIPDRFVEVLKKPNPAVMATVRADGAPVSVATWYLWDGGRILFNLDANRVRLAHLRADPRVSLTVLDSDWYRHISLHGTVTLQPDQDFADVDRITQHYAGESWRNRQRPRVSAWMTIESYHTWGWR